MVITRDNIERAENLLIDLCAGGLEERQELLRLIADALLGVEIYSGEKKVLGYVEIEPLAIEGAEPVKQTQCSDPTLDEWTPFLQSLQKECETLDNNFYGEYPELAQEASNMREALRKVLGLAEQESSAIQCPSSSQ